jgi:hypothetical protein
VLYFIVHTVPGTTVLYGFIGNMKKMRSSETKKPVLCIAIFSIFVWKKKNMPLFQSSGQNPWREPQSVKPYVLP